MSVKSGKTTQRRIVKTHRGFSIIKVKVIEWWKSQFSSGYSNIPDKVETYYDFCKEGNETRPSQAYECNAKSIAECMECIDNFIKDDTLYFTAEEYEKYVHKPNRKCDWAYGYDSLMKIMREHQKADKRMKILLEDRLTDANFHSACSYLSNCDYEGFENFVAKDCKFHEKFEVYTRTMRKAIKDPKRFEEGLKKVIEDYFLSQWVKDTTADVRYIEDW